MYLLALLKNSIHMMTHIKELMYIKMQNHFSVILDSQ